MNAINIPWLLLAAYWLITAFRVRPNERTEPAISRLTLIAVAIFGAAILSGRWLSLAWLAHRFVPDVPALKDVGTLLLWSGVAFAIWARYHIGEFWSARVTIKVGHKLVESGPYAYIRHPIYSGILLAMLGTAFAAGTWRGIAAFFMILIVFIVKARKEESMLTGQLGEMYQQYKERTGMLVPRLGASDR